MNMRIIIRATAKIAQPPLKLSASVALVAVLLAAFLQMSAQTISAQADATCEAPPAPVNVGLGSDGLALQISWQRGEGGAAPDGYVVEIARASGSGDYYEMLHGNDPWVEPIDYGWRSYKSPVWMTVDAGDVTEYTFTEHTFINHKGATVTAVLDDGKEYYVHVSAYVSEGLLNCYSSRTQFAMVTAHVNGTGRVLPPTDLRYLGNGNVAYTPRIENVGHIVQIVNASFVAENIEQGTDCLLPWSRVNGSDLTQWEGNDWYPWFSYPWESGTYFFVRVLVYRMDDASRYPRWDAWTYSEWILVEKGAETAPSSPSPPTTPLAR